MPRVQPQVGCPGLFGGHLCIRCSLRGKKKKKKKKKEAIIRERQKGMENSEEGKTYHRNHFWTLPPFCPRLLSPLEEMGTDQTNPTFCSLHKRFWRTRSIVLPPPRSHVIRFAPPFAAAQNNTEQGSHPDVLSVVPCESGRKKAHKHKLFALVNVQMALGQTAGCPRVNRAKKFMCSPCC